MKILLKNLRNNIFKQNKKSRTLEEWDEYYAELKNKHPIRYFLFEYIPDRFDDLKKKIGDMKWWILYRTTEKYHIIKTDLKPGHHSEDEQMIHALFSILVKHVENEDLYEYHDKYIKRQLKDLYNWWKQRANREYDFENVYPQVDIPLKHILNPIDKYKDKLNLFYEIEEKREMYQELWKQEDTKRMKQLIDLRTYFY